MRRRGFLTAGSWVVDRNISVDHWPGEDMLATVQDVTLAGGGSACNFACDIKRLDPDMPVETQGLIGFGEMGDALLDVARAHGIDATALHRTNEARTMVTDAYLSIQSGRRTHILFYGTAPLLTPEHFDFSATRAKILHVGLPGIHELMDGPWQDDPNGWVTILKSGCRAGLETNLELVSAPPEKIRRIVRPCLPHLDTLVVNDTEIAALAAMRTDKDGMADPRACERAASAVLSEGAMQVVVVHFPGGAVLVTRDGAPVRAPSVAVPQAERVGANGAGDAFSAGFFYGRHEGWSHTDCLELGHATAAASLRAADTYSGVGTVAECLDLATRWGWRAGM